jgi:precorrin-2 methylase
VSQESERIERRRRVVALIAALQKHDDERAEALIAELIADPDLRRVVGSFGVAGSSMVEMLSKVTGRSAEELLAELEEKMTSAPVSEGEPPPAPERAPES